MNSQIPSTATDAARRIFDKGAEAALHAPGERSVAEGALGGLQDGFDEMDDVASAVAPVVERGRQIGHHAMNLMRDRALQLSEQARHARNAAIVHVRQQPVKSVLTAVAIGAGLMAVATYLTRRRS